MADMLDFVTSLDYKLRPQRCWYLSVDGSDLYFRVFLLAVSGKSNWEV
jgi:hypothetical protein